MDPVLSATQASARPMTRPKTWRATNLPAAQRTDDIWFVDAARGWAVNANGNILQTNDGGDHWTRQAQFPDSYLRCIAFADAHTGWVGALSGPHRLYVTRDGGANWAPVASLPSGAPGRICGVSAVDTATVFASGTNYPNEAAAVLRTRDGGATWDSLTVPGAALLVDIFFETPERGWAVGGVDDFEHPARQQYAPTWFPGYSTRLMAARTGSIWFKLMPREMN
ncbi:MAG: hypothetical protein E5V30_17835, partial [Mesorhizobium sp.]